MKRMTSSNYNPCVNCIYSSSCSHIKYNAPVCPERARYDRLAAIEDILGDEYGLEELREMVQANIPRLIDEQSTISAVPVVRCRECENYDENGDCISLDLRIGIHSDTINYDFCPDPDFYCAYGQRKIETVLPKSDAKDESLEADHD